MKVSDVLEKVQEIAECGKNESSPDAHIMEDKLFLDVLNAIANGAKNPRALAAEAIKSAELTFSRWYE